MSGPTVIYDHRIELWISGSDADEDIAPIHAEPCNKEKTRIGNRAISKIKRLHKKAEPRKPSRLQRRGFDKSMTRGFDGMVRKRD